VLNLSASPTSFVSGGSSTITADLTKNNNGDDTFAQSGSQAINDGELVTIVTTLGQVGSQQVTKPTVQGKATASLSSTTDTGTAVLTATFDSGTATTSVGITAPPPTVTATSSSGGTSGGGFPFTNPTVAATVTSSGHVVSGKVQDGNGNPLPGRLVEAVINGVSCGSTTTNSTGDFSLTVWSASQQFGCGTIGATINFKVDGVLVNQTLSFQSGGFSTNIILSTSATPTATATVAAVATPVATGTSTAAVVVTGDWLDGSPSNPNAKQACPTGPTYDLLYWGGTDNAPIDKAAEKCPTARNFWVRRGNSWLGWSRTASTASDVFNIAKGEAAFINGPPATPTSTPTPTETVTP
jgi:hypothetical protein